MRNLMDLITGNGSLKRKRDSGSGAIGGSQHSKGSAAAASGAQQAQDAARQQQQQKQQPVSKLHRIVGYLLPNSSSAAAHYGCTSKSECLPPGSEQQLQPDRPLRHQETATGGSAWISDDDGSDGDDGRHPDQLCASAITGQAAGSNSGIHSRYVGCAL